MDDDGICAGGYYRVVTWKGVKQSSVFSRCVSDSEIMIWRSCQGFWLVDMLVLVDVSNLEVMDKDEVIESVMKKQNTAILTGLTAIPVDRQWEVEVIPLVVAQWSVKEMEWLKSLKVFGIDKEDGKKKKTGLIRR